MIPIKITQAWPIDDEIERALEQKRAFLDLIEKEMLAQITCGVWPLPPLSATASPLRGRIEYGPNNDETGPDPHTYRVSYDLSLKSLHQAANAPGLIDHVVKNLVRELEGRLSLMLAMGQLDDVIKAAVKEQITAQAKAAVRERLDEIVDDLVEGL